MDQLVADTPLFWLVWLPDLAHLYAVVVVGWIAAAVVLGVAAHRVTDDTEEGAR